MSIFSPRVRSSATERQVKNWLNFVSSGGATSKSIQAGTIDLTTNASATATITAVVLANSMILYLGEKTTETAIGRYDVSNARVELTNTTTVTAYKGLANVSTIVSYVVVEFNSGVLKSAQRGTIDMNNVTSNTATITAVTTSK